MVAAQRAQDVPLVLSFGCEFLSVFFFRVGVVDVVLPWFVSRLRRFQHLLRCVLVVFANRVGFYRRDENKPFYYPSWVSL